jgi:hypothetical protein
MKNILSDVMRICKNFEIAKNYDCRTELKSSEEKEPYFVMHTKGNFSVKAIHIALGVALVGSAYIISSVATSVKHRHCAKKS